MGNGNCGGGWHWVPGAGRGRQRRGEGDFEVEWIYSSGTEIHEAYGAISSSGAAGPHPRLP